MCFNVYFELDIYSHKILVFIYQYENKTKYPEFFAPSGEAEDGKKFRIFCLY